MMTFWALFARNISFRMEDENGQGGNVVTEYSSYEDFLDSQITATDLYYLESSNKERYEYEYMRTVELNVSRLLPRLLACRNERNKRRSRRRAAPTQTTFSKRWPSAKRRTASPK